VTTNNCNNSNRPYYGKATYRTEVIEPAKSGTSQAGGAWLIGFIGMLVGGHYGGWLGAILGGLIGAIIGHKFTPNTEGKAAVTRQVEITSPCIKCGGMGQVTAQIDGKTGFQCKNCCNSWSVGKGVCLICGKKGIQHENHWHCSGCNHSW
jgi:hypothetical protein